MNTILLVTALLVIPAGFLIVLGDEIDPIEQAQRIIRKNARKSGDHTQLRSRLEELGQGTEKDYVDFRIKQYVPATQTGIFSFSFLIPQWATKCCFCATFSSDLIL